MSHVMRLCVAGVTTLATLFSSLNVAAEEEGTAGMAAATTAAATSTAAVATVAPNLAAHVVAAAAGASLMGTEPLDLKVLAKKRGTADVYSDMQLKGVVADNRAVNVATGNNLITEGAFSGAAGVPMVVQNSGNNVLIQNATILNIQVK